MNPCLFLSKSLQIFDDIYKFWKTLTFTKNSNNNLLSFNLFLKYLSILNLLHIIII